LQKDNFHAVQFHPEKSAEIGQQLIKNFLEL
jgi:glutamine amidotransferase